MFLLFILNKYSRLLVVFFLFVAQSGCAVNRSEIVVSPPFIVGNKFLVSQGFEGGKTHKGLLNRFAVDLVMSRGEPVCAVEDGIVVAAKSTKVNYEKSESNYVHIRHKEGYVSDYQHLMPDSINVVIGDEVRIGQCFAQVGNSGRSTGPHLHFAILHSKGELLSSKPFKFISSDGEVYTPKYLEWVYN